MYDAFMLESLRVNELLLPAWNMLRTTYIKSDSIAIFYICCNLPDSE